MATYRIDSFADSSGNVFSFRDGVQEVDALPAVSAGIPGAVYYLSSDSKFYMLSADKSKWISISYPADSELSATSTNAIQNQAVTAALGKKQDTLAYLTESDVDEIWDSVS